MMEVNNKKHKFEIALACLIKGNKLALEDAEYRENLFKLLIHIEEELKDE